MDTGDDVAGLKEEARGNRQVFDEVLEDYVRQKLAYPLKQLREGAREVWLDASGCVWCVFDDPSFRRRPAESGDSLLADGDDPSIEGTCGLQVYWSLGDVLMPASCDVGWVARRIMDEACRQLAQQRYRCHEEDRQVDGELHHGVVIGRRGLLHEVFRRVVPSSPAQWGLLV